jgi:predicted DNA-binding transcriptional regulator YafY
LRAAIAEHERLSIGYLDLNELESHRDVRPLALDLQGQIWVLAAWCEARGGFRAFRLDRIMAITPTGEVFAEVPGQGLADYRALAAEVSA